jgi:hypothetical protein
MNDPIFHPAGEAEAKALVPFAGPVTVDTFGGRVHVEWDPQAAVTPLGQLPFFTGATRPRVPDMCMYLLPERR